MKAIGYGIDFGTTNSAVSVAYEDRVEVVTVERAAAPPTMLPSIVYLHRESNRLAGMDAANTFMVTGAQRHSCSRCPLVEFADGVAHTDCKQYFSGGGCLDSRLLAGLKFDLAEPSFHGTNSWARDYPVSELVAIVLARLKTAADAACGDDVRRAVLGYPLAFPTAEGQDFRRRQQVAQQRLITAAEAVGFEEIHLLPEPQAAALVEETDQGVVLAVDFGGGTFDAAVLEFSRDEAVVTALQGVAVGGELLDEALFRAKVADEIGLGATFTGQSGAALGMPQWMQKRFQSLAGIKHLIGNRETAVWVREHLTRQGGAALEPLEQLLYGGHAYGFYRAVEAAKIELSSSDSSRIVFKRPGLNIDIPLSRVEFDTIVGPYIESVHACITRALEQSGKSPTDISYVVSTGGSSRIPVYRSMLDATFGADRVVDRDPFTTVVTGLGYEAQGRWA